MQVCIWRRPNNLTPDRTTGCVFNAASKRGLAMLNEMLTEQAVSWPSSISSNILMVAMLIVSPLAPLPCKL
jgi:hypothetical protein